MNPGERHEALSRPGPCESLAEDLSAYADGELGPTAASRVEAHIGSCFACSGDLGRLRRLSDDLAAFVKVEPAPALFGRILRATGEDPRPAPADRFRSVRIAIPRIAAALPFALLWLFDRDLARRLWVTGDVRDPACGRHDLASLMAAVPFALVAALGLSIAEFPIALGFLALVWLGSTRLEERLTPAGLALAGLAGGLVAALAAYLAAPARSGEIGLAGVAATFLALQASGRSGLRVRVLGLVPCPIVARSVLCAAGLVAVAYRVAA